MAKIKVYRKDTGELTWVPEHFMDHPVLSKPFRKTPTQKARDAERAEREAAQAALAPLHQTPDSSAAEPATPTPTSDPASAGDK